MLRRRFSIFSKNFLGSLSIVCNVTTPAIDFTAMSYLMEYACGPLVPAQSPVNAIQQHQDYNSN